MWNFLGVGNLPPCRCAPQQEKQDRRSRLPNSWRQVQSFSVHGKHPHGAYARNSPATGVRLNAISFAISTFSFWNNQRTFGVWKLEDSCPKLELCRSVSRLSVSMFKNILAGRSCPASHGSQPQTAFIYTLYL